MEIGHFHAGQRYDTRRDGKSSTLLLDARAGNGTLRWKNQVCTLYPGTAAVISCDSFHPYHTGNTGAWDFLWVRLGGTGLNAYAAPLMDPLTPVRRKTVTSWMVCCWKC